jgi:peptidoglycan hydrolase CwlO-like protein
MLYGERKGSANGGESVGTVQKEKTTIALIGLCLVIGVMALLSTVYYTHASDVQNTANTLQLQNTNLQQQITQQNAQINTLGTQNQALNAQVNDLNSKIDSLNSEISSLSLQIYQLESTVSGMGGGGVSRALQS